jgi:hypothetical protein
MASMVSVRGLLVCAGMYSTSLLVPIAETAEENSPNSIARHRPKQRDRFMFFRFIVILLFIIIDVFMLPYSKEFCKPNHKKIPKLSKISRSNQKSPTGNKKSPHATPPAFKLTVESG